MAIPTKQLYQRHETQSNLVQKANAKRFEKWDTSHLEEGQNEKRREKAANKAKENIPQKLEDLFKIKINQVDPNTIDMQQLYQDNLPPETKQLEDFIQNYRGKETEDVDLIKEKKKNCFEKKRRIEDDILPAEGRDHMKISQMRVQQFEQEDEKNRQRQARENAKKN